MLKRTPGADQGFEKETVIGFGPPPPPPQFFRLFRPKTTCWRTFQRICHYSRANNTIILDRVVKMRPRCGNLISVFREGIAACLQKHWCSYTDVEV